MRNPCTHIDQELLNKKDELELAHNLTIEFESADDYLIARRSFKKLYDPRLWFSSNHYTIEVNRQWITAHIKPDQKTYQEPELRSVKIKIPDTLELYIDAETARLQKRIDDLEMEMANLKVWAINNVPESPKTPQKVEKGH